MISTTPTIFLVILQDDILGFAVGEDTLRSFAYYLAGVGAREELCKLLLFLPLLPFLIKRDDELEASLSRRSLDWALRSRKMGRTS